MYDVSSLNDISIQRIFQYIRKDFFFIEKKSDAPYIYYSNYIFLKPLHDDAKTVPQSGIN